MIHIEFAGVSEVLKRVFKHGCLFDGQWMITPGDSRGEIPGGG